MARKKKDMKYEARSFPNEYVNGMLIQRRLVLIFENDTIGDREWNPRIIKDLRAYCDYVERGYAGHTSPEIYWFDSGNKITVLCGSYFTEHTYVEGSFDEQFKIPRKIDKQVIKPKED